MGRESEREKVLLYVSDADHAKFCTEEECEQDSAEQK